MTIYSKKVKASKAWCEAFTSYESICGFEPMYQDDIDSGETTIYQAWHDNIRWLEDVVADVTHIQIPSTPPEQEVSE